MMLEFQQAVVPRKEAGESGGDRGGGGRDARAEGNEEVEQGARDDGEDESAMAPPGLAKLVGADAGTPQAPAAAAVANAPAVLGGFRGGGGSGRGGRAPLGTPHLRGGSNGSGARAPVGGAQQPPLEPQPQQQQQQLLHQVDQQHAEAVTADMAEEEVFAATRSPTLDYDSLAPPGI